MRNVTRYSNEMRLSPVAVSSLPTTNGRPHGRSTVGAMGQMVEPAVLRIAVVLHRFLAAYDRVSAVGYPLGRVHENSQEMSRRGHRFRRPSLSCYYAVIVALAGYSYTSLFIYGVRARIRRQAEVDPENVL